VGKGRMARVLVAIAIVAAFCSSAVVSEQGLDLILPEYELVQEPSVEQVMTDEASRIQGLIKSVEASEGAAELAQPKKVMKAPVAPVKVAAPVKATAQATAVDFLEDVKPTCDEKGECVCEIDPERCFAAPTAPVTTTCDKALAKCAALKKGHYSAAVLAACEKDAREKCVYTVSHTHFKKSYTDLCADEIAVKSEKMAKKEKKEKDFKEKSGKNEKTAKKAVEGGQKCKKKEFQTKKDSEVEVKGLKKQVQAAQEEEAKMSLKTKEKGAKMAKKTSEVEGKMFSSEQKSKEGAFKKGKESKAKCESKVKTMNERMYKKQTVSVVEQKEIYAKWNRHFDIEKTTKKTEAKHKKTAELAKKSELKEKKIEKGHKEKTDKKFAVEKKAKDIKIKTHNHLNLDACASTTGGDAKGEGCSFPFDWQGKTYYECITDDKHKHSFCLTAKKTLGYCKKGCKGAVHCKEEKKPVVKPKPKPKPKPVAKPVVKPAGSAPVPTVKLTAEALCKLREKVQEKQLKSLKENLSKASEKNDKAKNASTEKKAKCAQKMEGAQKKVEAKNKVIKKSGSEKKTKAEKDAKAEATQKKSYVKEASTKAAEVSLEKDNKEKILSLKKEAATKVQKFKDNEAKKKKNAAEKANKDPFADLKTYCSKLKKMQKLLITVKEVDGKKYKKLSKKSAATTKELKYKNVLSAKKLKENCCTETKETCSKIKSTSEGREKHAMKVASERQAKMEAKCELTREFAASEQKKLRLAICEAAHGEITTLLKSVIHASAHVEKMGEEGTQ